jgi:uncharacterized RDD family membrane protein YckC
MIRSIKNEEVHITHRFMNFCLDTIVFTFIVILAILFLKRYLPAFQYYNLRNNRILAFLIYFFYYFIFELTISSTPGKLITKTKVADMNSLSSPSAFKILVRTICRFIPLEGLSIFFIDKNKVLHDIISRTSVIYNR